MEYLLRVEGHPRFEKKEVLLKYLGLTFAYSL